MASKKEEYNQEPVFYCKRCLSLKIMTDQDMSYCDDCGNTEIRDTSIEHWQHMYFLRYGKHYVEPREEKENQRKTFTF